MIADIPSKSLVAALGLAGAVFSQTASGLSVTPNPAPAGKAFTLTLWGVKQDCHTAFTRETVTVSGNRIDLSYTPQTAAVPMGGVPENAASPGIVCPVYVDAAGQAVSDPVSILPNAPTFPMPALKAGEYEVWAEETPECLYTQPACAIRIAPQAAGTLKVAADSQAAYSISPATAAEGGEFELQLLSYAFDCATTYDNLSVNVAGNEITLTFLDHADPAGICPAIYRPYGPVFKMPALKAGSYAVKAYRMPSCHPCKMLGILADAGTLTVTAAKPRTGWYLGNRTVQAGGAFRMQLLRDDIGNCQTSFAREGATLVGDSIYASFVMESHPDHICIQNVSPFGPAFDMPALEPGAYPVFPVALPACTLAEPACAVSLIRPEAADTLIVAAALSLPLSALRARAPHVEIRGESAYLRLPAGGAGTWQARLISLDGRTLDVTRVQGEPGREIAVPVGRAPQGLSLLRLAAPDGSAHWIPILR